MAVNQEFENRLTELWRVRDFGVRRCKIDGSWVVPLHGQATQGHGIEHQVLS